jgi:acyl-CoA dehydrogenase
VTGDDTARWERPPVLAGLAASARRRGLWNAFLTAEHAAHLPADVDAGLRGPGLTVTEYAPLAELSGRSPWLAPEAMNCAAPDTGNMELLALFGTAEQRERWLIPLLDGRIRSAFAMTEPDVASSDPTTLRTRIRVDGDRVVVTGRKWWSTGAMSPQCQVFLVMGVSDPEGPRHRRHAMVLVPRDTPGVQVRRSTSVYGYDDGPHGGHGEVVFDDVEVPASALLGSPGEGFAMAQARLGPGRVHHCMRLLGMAERSLDTMCTRVLAREAFGVPLAEQGVVQEWIAEARWRLDSVRLLVLRTAWRIDTVGARAAAQDVAAIKVAVPTVALEVIDRAIQAHGGAGVSEDTPLAAMWAAARTLRIADGPDEVHRRTVARAELRRWRH